MKKPVSIKKKILFSFVFLPICLFDHRAHCICRKILEKKILPMSFIHQYQTNRLSAQNVDVVEDISFLCMMRWSLEYSTKYFLFVHVCICSDVTVGFTHIQKHILIYGIMFKVMTNWFFSTLLSSLMMSSFSSRSVFRFK